MIDPPSPSTAKLPAIAVEAAALFAERYGKEPDWIALAPGRVNLIGEHIDYNDGFVLPMAINRYAAIAACRSDSGRLRIASREMSESLDVAATAITCDGQPSWSAYVLGPLALCAEQGLTIGSLDVLLASDVPTGSGLSSSAAVEVATATLAEAVCEKSLGHMEKARLCQEAEHRYAHVPCGIMDQVTSAAATQDHALLLDCRNESLEQVALNDPAIAILIADTRVQHTLTDGQYARRREECQQALRELGASSFREISSEDIEWASGQLDAIALKRVRHVVSEISRTLAAAEAMRSHDWDALGQLMYESHASLRDDFCVSCPELDTLVAVAAAIGPAGGVYGSRMTGGGFGGCTVSLVAASEAPSIALRLQAKYKQQTEIEPTLFVTRPAAGSFLATTPTGDSARRSETG